MSKIVYNLLNSLEVTFEKQREKAKLEQKLSYYNSQQDLNESIRNDLENSKRALKGITQIISKQLLT